MALSMHHSPDQGPEQGGNGDVQFTFADGLTTGHIPESADVRRHRETLEGTSRAFPEDGYGNLDPQAIKPGMVDARWGIVTGKYSGPVNVDIARAPMDVPPSQRSIAAARHYAELLNTRRLVLLNGEDERAKAVSIRIDQWLADSLKKGWRKEVDADKPTTIERVRSETDPGGLAEQITLDGEPGPTVHSLGIKAARAALAVPSRKLPEAEIDTARARIDEMREQLKAQKEQRKHSQL